MTTPLRAAVIAIAVFTSAIAMTALQTIPAQAMHQEQASVKIEIEPICSSEPRGISLWKVNNFSDTAATVTWNNFENGLQGTYNATPGITQMTTGYVATDPNNTTTFTWPGGEGTTNAKIEACEEPEEPVVPEPECIDGNIQQNLVVTWLSKNSVSVITRDGMPLCDDVTVFLSSYTMPDNYDGNGFEGNPTAYPQTVTSSIDAVLEKGTDGRAVLIVAKPDKCKNTQIDFYYGPEITTVGPDGHGTQNIEAKVYMKSDSKKCQPGNGGETPQPPVQPEPPVTPNPEPETPVTPPVHETPKPEADHATPQPAGMGSASSPELPAELPQTGGVDTLATVLYTIVIGLATYALAYGAQRRLLERE